MPRASVQICTHWWCKHISHLGSEKSQQTPLCQSPCHSPPFVCSSFFPCEHWCRLPVMNASSPAHWVWTLLIYSNQWRKKNLKIKFGRFFFSCVFFLGNSWPSLTLLQPPCHSSYMPLIPSSHLPSSLRAQRVKVELLMITLQTSVPSSSPHILTHPPQASFLSPFLLLCLSYEWCCPQARIRSGK